MAVEFEYHVFLSHASPDNRAVRQLGKRLKGEGLRVCPRRMTASAGTGSARSIPLAIEQGLQSSGTLVLVMSQAAFDSEWVTLQRHALFRDPTNQQRRFIPVPLDYGDIKDPLKCFITHFANVFFILLWGKGRDD